VDNFGAIGIAAGLDFFFHAQPVDSISAGEQRC
jgi:hypothetical protein